VINIRPHAARRRASLDEYHVDRRRLWLKTLQDTDKRAGSDQFTRLVGQEPHHAAAAMIAVSTPLEVNRTRVGDFASPIRELRNVKLN
jgi:hypothetical protein